MTSPAPSVNLDARTLQRMRPRIVAHCYRMLGSPDEAEDATQEALTRAWRFRDGFSGRSSLSTWMHTIATRVCLDQLKGRKARARPFERGPSLGVEGPIEFLPAETWLEALPDPMLDGEDPESSLAARQRIGLAFVAALQQLPARQRAALLLIDVLGFTPAEAAEALELGVTAVRSALQRAREGAPHREEPPKLQPEHLEMARSFQAAFEAYDMNALVRLLADDVRMSMPPISLWLEGAEAITAWMVGRGEGCRGSRLVPVRANGLPAFAQYRPPNPSGVWPGWSLIVLEPAGDKLGTITHFLDVERCFPRFGLPVRAPSDFFDVRR